MHVLALFSLLLALSAHAQPSPTLNDLPIAGGGMTSLDGSWNASSPSQNLHITGTVPGDIVTDLFKAKIIGDPIYDLNFLNSSTWNNHVWIYNKSFTLSDAEVRGLNNKTGALDMMLVFDGIKMAASIAVNGDVIGNAVSQFERLTFSLRTFLQSGGRLVAGTNILTVTFDPSVSEHGLYSQCSGGWDWAPFTLTLSADNHTTFTRGIWKSVYIVSVPWLAMTDLMVHTRYTGAFPTAPLVSGKHAPFEINVTVALYAPAKTSATLELRPSWLSDSQQPALRTALPVVAAGSSAHSVQMQVTAAQISLWWPAGMGAQTVYTMNAVLSPSSPDAAPVNDSRQFGFRFFALVTGNDTDPAYVEQNQNATGTDTMGMRFRINGMPFFARGANVIPMDNMEGRFEAEAHRQMVISARDGSMNMLRIWGGGVYLPQIFYDTCDQVGVMVYHDLMNRGSWQGSANEINAYRHQVRRLSHHPSIVIWDGCNECYPAYAGIVPRAFDVIVQEDASRVFWPSCPAPGWESGVNRLTSIPDGEPFKLMGGTQHVEEHGPYQHGDGWPAVNGNPTGLNLFHPNLPLSINQSVLVGVNYNSTFVSEFGTVHWSSFESVSATLSPQHWSLHGGAAKDNCTYQWWANTCHGPNPLAQRNYPCDSIIITYFGGKQTQLDAVGEQAFKRQLFLCLIGSALKTKTYIEGFRAGNAFGTLEWQLNEIWPTGGWGSLEYGTSAVPGQVVGGRWKPLHYWLKDALFTDVLISCGVTAGASTLSCFVKNDAYAAVKVDIIVDAVDLQSGVSTNVYSALAVVLEGGPGSMRRFAIPAVNATRAVLAGTVRESTGAVLTYNTMFLTTPAHLVLGNTTLDMHIAADPNSDQSIDITITKSSDAAALFVTLTTLAPGRFSQNAFLMSEHKALVTFMPFGALDAALLRASLRIEHAAQYI